MGAGHKFRALFFPECFTCSIRLDIKGVRKVLSDALSDWASPRTASLDSSNWTAESLRTLSFYDIENLAFRNPSSCSLHDHAGVRSQHLVTAWAAEKGHKELYEQL